jgi:uncharacterized protein
VPGRITLALYNSYDPTHFHEAMRRAVARAAPLAHAFDMNLALVGFPWHAYRTKAGERPDPRTPQEVAALINESTSIGEAQEPLVRLAAAGRLQAFPVPDKGWPPQLGTLVLATQAPDEARRLHVDTLARRALDGESFTVIIGLGPRGVPRKVEEAAQHHLELTGRGTPLETATAMGVLAGRLAHALGGEYAHRSPRITVDALVVRDDRVLLVRRGRDPFAGAWALPGGFVDAGETCASAVVRELREETGLVGRRPRLAGVYDDPHRDPRFPTVSLIYELDADGEPRGGDDAADAAFHPLTALPPLAFDHERILRECAAGRIP